MSLTTNASAEPVVIDLGDFGGRPTVQVMIGEAGPFTFVVDSGAPGIILDVAILDQLNLTSIGKQMVGSPGGEPIEVDNYEVRDFRVGDLEISVQSALALDMQDIRRTSPIEMNGIISFWLLSKHYSVLDLAARKLIIDEDNTLSPDDEGVFSFSTNPPFPYPEFLVQLGDFEISAHFDTGSPGYIMTGLNNAEALSLTGEPEFMREANMVGRAINILGATLNDEANIGSITLSSPEIAFIEGGFPGVNIGSDFIDDYLIEFDMNNELARISEKHNN